MTLTRRGLGALLASLPFMRKAQAAPTDDWTPIRETRSIMHPDTVMRSTEAKRGHLLIGIEQTQIDGFPAGPALLYAYDIIARPVYSVMFATFATFDEAKHAAPAAWTPAGYRLSTSSYSRPVAASEARGEYLKEIGKHDNKPAPARLTPWPDLVVTDPHSIPSREGEIHRHTHADLYQLVLSQHMAHIGHVRPERT